MESQSKGKNRVKKIIISVVLATFVLSTLSVVFFYSNVAKAQVPGAPQPTIVIADIPAKIFQAVAKALKTAADVAFKNVLRQFLNKIAYDAAVYIASGGKGQKPLFLTQPGKLLEKTADNAYGLYLEKLSKDIWGKTLCEQPPFIKARLDVWARQVKEPKITKATCPISKAIANIEKSTHEQLIDFSKNFNPRASEFGAYLSITSGAEEFSTKELEKTKFVKELEGEFESVKSTITGAVKTPAKTVGDALSSIVPESIRPYATYTGTAIADAIGVFTSTLTNKLLKRIFEKGFNPEADTSLQRELAGGASRGVAAARTIFASLNQPDFNVGGPQDILNTLASCPPNPAYNNCIIDERFRIAIERDLTVQEALDQGLLDGAKIFGFDSQGREPSYRNGYPYRSMLILRNYRIIPVGWELAAQYIRNFEPKDITLNDLVKNYEVTTSPFYHLVDPNWVLKAPELFCKRQGVGEQIVSEQFVPTFNLDDPENQISLRQVERADYCSDEQTCLFENEDGSCKRFGYCTEEKPIWRFQGDKCGAQNNTCQAFEKSDGTSVAYLKNTLDYDGCTANNVGCQIYCNKYDSATGKWDCDAGENIISFNAKATSCDAKAEGCAEFIRTKPGLGTNIFANGSFEKYSGTVDNATDTDTVDQWPFGASNIVSDAFNGLVAVQVDVGAALRADALNTGYSLANRTFNVSFFGKKFGGTCDGNVNTFTVADEGGTDTIVNPFNYYDSWSRYAGTITFKPTTTTSKINISIQNGPGCTATVDSFQLEETATASNYKDYGTVNQVYLNGQRLACTAEEVGCEQYASSSTGEKIPGIVSNPQICDPNDPSSCDQCPAEFVGCKAYREMPIEHQPFRTGEDLISFLASTGKTCPASAVGCEEYTNLDEVARGGEGREYYSLIRQCVLDDAPEVGAYYTWVGSDEFGYQLKKFSLKKSNLGDGAPCTNIQPEPGGWPACSDSNIPGDPYYKAECGTDTCDLGTNTCVDSGAACTTNKECVDFEVAHNPDCGEFYDNAGNIYYRLRSRIIYASADCHPYRNTIDGADKTYHMIPGQGIQCQAQYAGCRAYKGNAGTNIRTLISSNFENGTIAPWRSDAPLALNPSTESINVGGHSMLVFDTASVPVETLIQQGKSYIISFWAKADAADTIVRAGFDNPGNPDTPFPGQAAVKAGDWNRYQLGPVYFNQTVASGAKLSLFSGGNAYFIDNIVFQEVIDNVYFIKNSYRQCAGYENCDAYSDRDDQTHYLKSFSKLCSADKVGCEALIDTKNSSSAFSERYRINPDRGDVNGDGQLTMDDVNYLQDYIFGKGPAPYPLALGDVNNSGRITQADTVLLVNWILGGPQPPVDYPSSFLTVPADDYVFYVNDGAKYCTAAQKGCSRLAAPALDTNNVVTNYGETRLLNNPDTYSQTLCNSSQNKCSEYSAGDAKYYFKDPNRQCEFREARGTSQRGWYKVGSTAVNPDCPMVTGFCLGGKDEGSSCNEDLDCDSNICQTSPDINSQPTDGWAGICPAEQSGCQDYRDPSEPMNASTQQCNVKFVPGQFGTVCTAGDNKGTTGCEISDPAPVCDPDADGDSGTCEYVYSCRPYYYLSQSVDTASCFGTVDPRLGCRLFYDPLAGDPNYDSDKTYKRVDDTKQAQAPVSCANPADCDSNLILKVRNDRECAKWLECTTSTRVTNTKGEVEEVCLDIKACNKLDQLTGTCIGSKYCAANHLKNCESDLDCGSEGPCIDIDTTGNITPRIPAPSNIDEIKNYSGIVKAGANWGCSNDPTIQCTKDADCGAGNTCRVIEGFYPTRIMKQVGLGGATETDLVANGDMGDNDINQGWTQQFPAEWERVSAGSTRVIEEGLDGRRDNKKIDENNVMLVDPDDNKAGQGVQYNLIGLSSTRYTVSFHVRYDAPPQPDDNIVVDLGFFRSGQEIPNSANTFGVIKPSTSWQKIILGPLQVSVPNGTESAKLRFIQLGPSVCRGGVNDGQPCTTDSDCGFGGFCKTTEQGLTFYLDNVSLKPTLAVQDRGGADNSDDLKIARSCRMYPRSDSSLCQYTDTNGAVYKGWYGYCLEQDPKNPSQCLSWWPVDIIQGESNVFSAGVKAGYADRVPLFMCVETKGNYSPVLARPFGQSCSGSAECAYNNQADCESHGCDWSSFMLGDRCKPEFNTCTLKSGDETACLDEPGCVWKGQVRGDKYKLTLGPYGVRDGGDNACQMNNNGGVKDVNTNPCAGFESWVIFDVTNSGNNVITEDDIESINARDVGPRAEYDYVSIIRFTKERVETGVQDNIITYHKLVENTDIDGDGRLTIKWYNQYTVNCHGNAAGINCLWVEIRFDKNTKKLFGVYLIGEDATGNAIEGSRIELDIKTRETCQKIAQVVLPGGENKAWSGRVQTGSSYPVGYVDYLTGLPYPANYPFTADFPPFGGAKEPVASSESVDCQNIIRTDPMTWDTRCNESSKQPLYVELLDTTRFKEGQARAGQPYSCMNVFGCGEAVVCTGGSLDGKLCDTADNTTNCQKGGGTCIGFKKPGGGVSTANPKAIESLKSIFASVYSVWGWDAQKEKYDVTADAATLRNAWKSAYDGMQLCAGNRPTTHIPDYCGIQPKVEVNNIKVIAGGKTYGIVEANGGDISVLPNEEFQLTFTTTVDREQLPLRYIRIDWEGSGSWDPNCGPPRCTGDIWNKAPKNDIANPHSFAHSYTSGQCAGGCKPRIQIVDNWDWCNGSNGAGTTPTRDDTTLCTSYDEYGGTITVQ